MDRSAVAEGAAAATGGEELVEIRVVDDSELDGAVDGEGDGDGARMEVFDEVRGSVDGIDDEESSFGGEWACRAFFADEVRVGDYVSKSALEHVLHLFVIVCDEIGGAGFLVDPDVPAVGAPDDFAAAAHQTADRFEFVRHDDVLFRFSGALYQKRPLLRQVRLANAAASESGRAGACMS